MRAPTVREGLRGREGLREREGSRERKALRPTFSFCRTEMKDARVLWSL